MLTFTGLCSMANEEQVRSIVRVVRNAVQRHSVPSIPVSDDSQDFESTVALTRSALRHRRPIDTGIVRKNFVLNVLVLVTNTCMKLCS